MTINEQSEIRSHEEGARKGLLVAVIALFVVIFDQVSKFLVKTRFYLGEDLPLTDWWHIKFIENNGMAFGMELTSKYILTFGRIAAVVLLIWFAIKVLRCKAIRTGFYIALALIIAGAAGNIFDCVFYGVIFNNPMPPQTAEFLPPEGYAPLFHGMVVDMLYFPLFSFVWPEWIPFVGGQEFEFFQYIFNVADSAICIGVALIIFFFSKDASVAFNFIGERKHAGKDPDTK
ncbi:MAG: lipoprotein signal peptidase [Muribaculaceae bacterium]|nr:lipoprotein signal peptidase [Muribaculaceae bacterium]